MTMPEQTATPDLTKYASIDDPCPFCGVEGQTDSTDDDGGPYSPDGQYETHEKWSCGACEAVWDAIFTFVRPEKR